MQNTVRWRSDLFWYICQRFWRNNYLEPLVKQKWCKSRGLCLHSTSVVILPNTRKVILNAVKGNWTGSLNRSKEQVLVPTRKNLFSSKGWISIRLYFPLSMNKSIELYKVICHIVPLRFETLQEGAPVKDLKPITEVSKLRQCSTRLQSTITSIW